MFWERFYNLCTDINSKPNPVGKKLGIASGTISAWKTGTLPDREAIEKIADFFNCSVDYLLGRTDNPTAHIKSSEVNTQLIAMLAQLTPTEQEMISLQIKGILLSKNNPPPKGDGQE